MASTSLYLDQRYKREDGTFPVKIKASFRGNKGFLIPTSMRISPDQWDGNEVVRHPNREKLNIYLRDRQNKVSNAIYDLEMAGRIGEMSMSSIKNYVEGVLGGGGDRYSFIDHFEKVIESKVKPTTREIYRQTLLKIRLYDGQNLDFTEITYSWLKGFERFMSGSGISINSINLHMRNVRAVLNDAINEDKAPLSCYPFRKFKIEKEQTRHRALSITQLCQLCNFNCEDSQKQYRDIFMLIFYLGGINIVDLCNLKEINRGYIEYRRAKTGRLYKIKVEPEALAIIERYRGQKYLLDILDRYQDHKNYLHRLNKNLSEIGTVEILPGRGGKKAKTGLFPGLSTYWARHTWATIAASLNIPKETIAATLGHGGKTVTDIYISFDQRKIDGAKEPQGRCSLVDLGEFRSASNKCHTPPYPTARSSERTSDRPLRCCHAESNMRLYS